MHRIVRRLVMVASIIMIWLSGVVVGVYYQPEIDVMMQAFQERNIPSMAPSPLPEGEAEQATLTIPAFEQPLPLVFSTSLDEEKIQEDLKRGASVLPLGTTFGEPGNVVITAHSSGTLSFGPYRFAFAQLSDLQIGQAFTITTAKARYTYTVYGRDIVWPHEVDRLPNDERSTVTLVTCWPKWTNLKRLLVHGELTKTDPLL